MAWKLWTPRMGRTNVKTLVLCVAAFTCYHVVRDIISGDDGMASGKTRRNVKPDGQRVLVQRAVAELSACPGQILSAEPKLRPIFVPFYDEKLQLKHCVEVKRLHVKNHTNNTYKNKNNTVVYNVCTHQSDQKWSISARLQMGDTPQKPLLDTLMMYLNMYQGCTLIDIGANIGLMTLLAAKLGHQVIAVEPLPENMDRLREGIALGHVKDRVTVFQNAVSDQRMTMSLMTVQERLGMTWLVCESACVTHGNRVCTNQSVDTVYMDDLLPVTKELGVHTAIVKIDVEGHEAAALGQSAALFEAVDIPVVIMEWRPKQWGVGMDRVQGMVDMFNARGYRAVGLGDHNGTQTLDDEWETWPGDIVWLKMKLSDKTVWM